MYMNEKHFLEPLQDLIPTVACRSAKECVSFVHVCV